MAGDDLTGGGATSRGGPSPASPPPPGPGRFPSPRPRRAGPVPPPPAPMPCPPAEVDVLHVHEVGLVEATQLVPGLAADEAAGARDPVDRAAALVIPVKHLVAAAEAVPGGDHAEEGVT